MFGFGKPQLGTGYIPDKPDARDIRFDPKLDKTPYAAGMSNDLRGLAPILYQRDKPECVAHSVSTAITICERLAGLIPPEPISIEGLHFLSRYQHGAHLDPTSGTYIREMLKVMHKNGAPLERLHPTRYTKASMRKTPSAPALIEGNSRRGGRYVRLYNLDDMRAANLNRVPFIFGIEIDENFAALRGDRQWIRGGASKGWHAMTGVFVDERDVWAQNSWDKRHGLGGFVRIPFSVIARARDIQAVHGWERIRRTM